jgi:hypothetical protein
MNTVLSQNCSCQAWWEPWPPESKRKEIKDSTEFHANLCFLSLLSFSASYHWKRIIQKRSDDLSQCKEPEKVPFISYYYRWAALSLSLNYLKPLILLFTVDFLISFDCSDVDELFLTLCESIRLPPLVILWIFQRCLYL